MPFYDGKQDTGFILNKLNACSSQLSAFVSTKQAPWFHLCPASVTHTKENIKDNSTILLWGWHLMSTKQRSARPVFQFPERDWEALVSQDETETEKPLSHTTRLRLKSFCLRLRDRYWDWKILVLLDEIDAKTNDAQSQTETDKGLVMTFQLMGISSSMKWKF